MIMLKFSITSFLTFEKKRKFIFNGKNKKS